MGFRVLQRFCSQIAVPAFVEGRVIEFVSKGAVRIGIVAGDPSANRLLALTRDNQAQIIDRGQLVHTWSSSLGSFTVHSLDELHRSACGVLFYEWMEQIKGRDPCDLLDAVWKQCLPIYKTWTVNSESVADLLYGSTQPDHVYIAAKLLATDERFARAAPGLGYRVLNRQAVQERKKVRFVRRVTSWRAHRSATTDAFTIESEDVALLNVIERMMPSPRWQPAEDVRLAAECLSMLHVRPTSLAIRDFLHELGWWTHPLRRLDHHTIAQHSASKKAGAVDSSVPVEEEEVANGTSVGHVRRYHIMSPLLKKDNFELDLNRPDTNIERVISEVPPFSIDRKAQGSVMADDAFGVEAPHILFKGSAVEDTNSRWVWLHVTDVSRCVPPESVLARQSSFRLRTIYSVFGAPSTMLPPKTAAALALSSTGRNKVLSFGARISTVGELLDYRVQFSDIPPITRYTFPGTMEAVFSGASGHEVFRQQAVGAFELLSSWAMRNHYIRRVHRISLPLEADGLKPVLRFSSVMLVKLLGAMGSYVADSFAADRHVVLPRAPLVAVSSPLRRFLDLCSHMQLRAVLERPARCPPFSLEDVRRIECAVMEQSAAIKDATWQQRRAYGIEAVRMLGVLYRHVFEAEEVFLPATVQTAEDKSPTVFDPDHYMPLGQNEVTVSIVDMFTTTIAVPDDVVLADGSKIIVRIRQLNVRRCELEAEFHSHAV